jgi:hypothetical protein
MGAVGYFAQRWPARLALVVGLAGLWLCASARAAPAGVPAMMTYIKGLVTQTPSVWVSGLDGSSPMRLGLASSALLSPDGSEVAAVSVAKGQTVKASTLSLYASSGAASSTVTRNVQIMQLLAWSADSKLLLVAVGASPAQLKVINPTTGQSHMIATGVIDGASFAPGPSNQVVYARAAPNSSLVNIYVTSASGTGTRQLTHDGRSEYPLWGPSGIVYSRETARAKNPYPELQLWFIRASGAGARQLTHVPVDAHLEGLTPIALSANGKHLLANFVGPDHTEAYTLDLSQPKTVWRDLGNGNIGDAVSADGKTVLVTKGRVDNLAQLSIQTVPWAGGKATTVVTQGAYASWNS